MVGFAVAGFEGEFADGNAAAALMLVSSRDWMSQPASVRSRSMVWRARPSAVMGIAGKSEYNAGGPFR